MFKINLVPEVQQQKQKTAQRNTVATITAIAILAVCIVALFIIGGIKVAKTASLGNTNDDIANLEAEAEQYKELEETVLSLEKGLAGIKQILSDENNWTKLLPHLEAATPGDVQFTRLNIEGATIEADLKGKDINSLARMVESYKEYKVVTLSGVNTEAENVTITIDGSEQSIVTTQEDGSWKYAASFNPASDHSITIEANGSENKLSYVAETKELSGLEGGITASVKNLFSNIENSQYSKEGQNINFDLTFKFDSEAIW